MKEGIVIKTKNSIAPQVRAKSEKFSSFAAYTADEKIKSSLIQMIGGDTVKAGRLIATLNNAVATTPKLQECDYDSIITAALQGEIANDLSYSLGQYGIIPYGNRASYQLQVNGLKQLCIRSAAYENADCYDVREGEYLGRDPQTRSPIISWIDDDDERDGKPIIGYYAFYLLGAQYCHFFKCIYWTHEQVLKHADRYAPAFDLEKYRALLAGELSENEVLKLQGGKDKDGKEKKGSSPWYANPDDMSHIKMCKKTVLKQLLNDGFAPKSIQMAINADNYAERYGDTVISDPNLVFDGGSGSVSLNPVDVDENGEVIEATGTVTGAALIVSKTPETPVESEGGESAAKSAPAETGEGVESLSDAFFKK